MVRQDLEYYILLGLQFLIAVEIMRTIRNPTLEEPGILGAIVAIRTIVSFHLPHEMRRKRPAAEVQRHQGVRRLILRAPAQHAGRLADPRCA